MQTINLALIAALTDALNNNAQPLGIVDVEVSISKQMDAYYRGFSRPQHVCHYPMASNEVELAEKEYDTIFASFEGYHVSGLVVAKNVSVEELGRMLSVYYGTDISVEPNWLPSWESKGNFYEYYKTFTNYDKVALDKRMAIFEEVEDEDAPDGAYISGRQPLYEGIYKGWY